MYPLNTTYTWNQDHNIKDISVLLIWFQLIPDWSEVKVKCNENSEIQNCFTWPYDELLRSVSLFLFNRFIKIEYDCVNTYIHLKERKLLTMSKG